MKINALPYETRNVAAVLSAEELFRLRLHPREMFHDELEYYFECTKKKARIKEDIPFHLSNIGEDGEGETTYTDFGGSVYHLSRINSTEKVWDIDDRRIDTGILLKELEKMVKEIKKKVRANDSVFIGRLKLKFYAEAFNAHMHCYGYMGRKIDDGKTR